MPTIAATDERLRSHRAEVAVVGVERGGVGVVVVDDRQADLVLERAADVEPVPVDVPEVRGAARGDDTLRRRRPGVSRPTARTRCGEAGLVEDVVEGLGDARTATLGPSRTGLGVSTRVSTRNRPVLSRTVALFVVPPLSRPTTTHGAEAVMSASLGCLDPRSRRNPARRSAVTGHVEEGAAEAATRQDRAFAAESAGLAQVAGLHARARRRQHREPELGGAGEQPVRAAGRATV